MNTMQRIIMLVEMLTDERAGRMNAEAELAQAQAKLAEWDALFAPPKKPRARPKDGPKGTSRGRKTT